MKQSKQLNKDFCVVFLHVLFFLSLYLIMPLPGANSVNLCKMHERCRFRRHAILLWPSTGSCRSSMPLECRILRVRLHDRLHGLSPCMALVCALLKENRLTVRVSSLVAQVVLIMYVILELFTCFY